MPSLFKINSYWKLIWMKFKSHRGGLFGLILLTTILFFTFFGPSLSGYSYEATNLSLKNSPPSWQFWFGSDDLGRDVFTRVCYGARISLFVGMTAACLDLCIGIMWGGMAALSGGKTEEIMMRIADVLYCIPSMLIAILLIVILGSGLASIIVALTITGWITMARIVRGQILLLKEMDYILAARIFGASPQRILFKHLLPNMWGPLFVTLTVTISGAIFSEAFLSFVGLGVQAPLSSWGTMANEGLKALKYYPWRLFFPGLFISLTLLSFYMISEGLKYAFNKSQQMETV